MILENELVKFEFNTTSGFMSFFDKKKQDCVISKAYSSISYDSKELNTLNKDKLKSDVEEFENEIGKGITLILKFMAEKETPELVLNIELFENMPYIFLRNSVINSLEKGIQIESLNPIVLSDAHSSNLNLGTTIKDWKMLGGAYQSWAPIKLFGPFDKNFVPSAPVVKDLIRRNFLLNPEEKLDKYEQIGDNYLIIKNLKTQNNILLGYLTFKNQFSQIIIQFNKKNIYLNKLQARSYADSIILKPNKELSSELFMINFITPPLENLTLYADIIKKINKTIPWSRVPTGYCTWYIYFNKINEEECLKNLHFIAERRDQIPITYFQLDDGYQITIGDWEANKKFQKGMKNFVERVEAVGLKAGLWIAPFFVGKKSKTYQEHPDWVLKDRKGKPIILSRNPIWGIFNPIYGLDCSHPEVQEWLRKLFIKITNEWGFKCIKIDFIFGACASSNFYDKNMTRAQVYRKGLEIIRETIGSDVLLLGCGAPIGPSIGLVNAMRVSADTHTSWDPWYTKLLRKKFGIWGTPCVINAMRNNIRSFFMHKKFWMNDPDCLMVRLEKTKLNEDEVKSEITCIGLLNGYYFLSDDFSYVNQEQIKLIKKFFPYNGKSAIPIDLFENEMPQILDLPIKTDIEDYHVTGVFNWEDKTKSIALEFKDLKLEKEEEFHVFEFWEKKYYGTFRNRIRFTDIKKHSCKLVAIRKVNSDPQLLSTSFHFTQGRLVVKSIEYNHNTKKLYVNLRFPGTNEGSLFFYNPTEKDWQIDDESSSELIKKTKNIYELKVKFENEFETLIAC